MDVCGQLHAPAALPSVGLRAGRSGF